MTEAQKRVLSRLAGGDEAWTITGRASHAFWYGNVINGENRPPRLDTLHALWKRGLIADYARERGGQKYRITEAGRSALASSAGPDHG